MECFVSLPNSTVKTVEVSLKGKGQECMDKLCEQLDITEQDYFGLVYKARCGDSYWLNLRNRIDRQLFGQPPFRLFLKVKFFVPPHDLMFPETRNQFYEQVKQNLETKKLVLESEDDIEQTVALMAQIEYGQHDTRTHQLNIYKRLYSIVSDQDPSQQQIRRFVDTHIALGHMTKEQAQYRVLQNVFKLSSYGVEYHDVMLDSEAMTVGVGPKGVFMYNSDMELIERIMFQRITKAEHTGRSCTLRVVNDNASEMDLVLRHSSPSMANAMYRSVTEMHSFFFCDTVHDEVSMQFSRDLKGTLASIFNEHTTLGRDYVFDIKRTAQEALDYARRQSYQMSQDAAMENKAMELKRSESKTRLQPAEERCKELEETLEEIADTLTCCVCADSELNTALVPCGHLLCWDCAERLTECPLCRTEVTARQRVYYPACKGATDMRSVSLKVVASPVHAYTHCYKKRRKTDVNSRAKP